MPLQLSQSPAPMSPGLPFPRWLKLTDTYSAFAFFLSDVCRISCGSNCFCYVLGLPLAYAPKHPRRGVEPQEEVSKGSSTGVLFTDE